MNIFAVTGLILGTVVLFAGFYLASPNFMLFVDGPSAFIVLGGTFAAVSISFQMNVVFKMFKVFFQKFIGGKRYSNKNTIAEIIRISELYRTSGAVDGFIEDIKDPFMKECLTIIQDEILDKRGSIKLMKKRNENIYKNYNDDTQKFQAMGKYPPAFGMMGTTIGMIVLLANLGGKDAMKMIGPAMGVCLITTLYGVIVANLGFIPVSEFLEDSTKELRAKNDIVIEGMELMLDKTNPVVLAETLNSYLIPSERLDWKEIVG
jgi:chemotaxis protein MotA